jgi:RHS repeat-associated protein
MVEKENGVVESDTRVVWCERLICEERAADGITVTRRPFTRGEQVGGASQFFDADHLGCVAAVTNSSATLVARYAFDPCGRRTLEAGSDVTTVGYTGHRMHAASGLELTMFRGYDPALARWLSEDPASHVGGLNLYGYVANNPIRKVDPFGLAPWDHVLCWWYYGDCEKSAKKCAAELRKRDLLEVLEENQCTSWGALVVKKCFVENPDCMVNVRLGPVSTRRIDGVRRTGALHIVSAGDRYRDRGSDDAGAEQASCGFDAWCPASLRRCSDSPTS